MTAGNMYLPFAVIGIIFLLIGGTLYVVSSNVKEYVVDYTDCKDSTDRKCSEYIEQNKTAANQPTGATNCKCQWTVAGDKLGGSWDGEVFMYYGLDNFYQNHRDYVKSRDDKQLLGRVLFSALYHSPKLIWTLFLLLLLRPS